MFEKGKKNKKEKENNLNGVIFFSKFKVIKKLQSGSFGSVYEGINLFNHSSVAIKIENKLSKEGNLGAECSILLSLKGFGIPKIISFGYSGNYAVLVEELLGSSIFDVFKQNGNFLPLKEVCMIAIQVIDRLEYIHSKNFVHRDIKPQNFLLGKSDSSIIYLVDFGMSKKYRSSHTNKHINFAISKYFYGTLRYSSINSLRGVEQSRRDDLEAAGYMFVLLLKGRLPWKTEGIELKQLSINKKKITPEDLCYELPTEMVKYVKYTRELKFEQEPNYNYLRNLFRSILLKNYGKTKFRFFWDNRPDSVNKSQNLLKYKDSSPQIRLYRTEKNSIETHKKKNTINKSKETNENKNSFSRENLKYKLNKNIIRKCKKFFLSENHSLLLTSFNKKTEINLPLYKKTRESHKFNLTRKLNLEEEKLKKNISHSPYTRGFKNNSILFSDDIIKGKYLKKINNTKERISTLEKEDNNKSILYKSTENKRKYKFKDEEQKRNKNNNFDVRKNIFNNYTLFFKNKNNKNAIIAVEKQKNIGLFSKSKDIKAKISFERSSKIKNINNQMNKNKIKIKKLEKKIRTKVLNTESFVNSLETTLFKINNENNTISVDKNPCNVKKKLNIKLFPSLPKNNNKLNYSNNYLPLYIKKINIQKENFNTFNTNILDKRKKKFKSLKELPLRKAIKSNTEKNSFEFQNFNDFKKKLI